MNSLLFYLFLTAVLRIREIHSIDANISQIHKKVKQIDNPIDSQNVSEVFNSNLFLKLYFNFFTNHYLIKPNYLT